MKLTTNTPNPIKKQKIRDIVGNNTTLIINPAPIHAHINNAHANATNKIKPKQPIGLYLHSASCNAISISPICISKGSEGK